MAQVADIQKQLGVTPRGSIKGVGVREVRLYDSPCVGCTRLHVSPLRPHASHPYVGRMQVRLYKETQTTRLGIIFHQNTPAELGDISSDLTPRVAGQQPVVIPVIKVLDKSGIAGSASNLNEGDQVLSVNGKAALSNIQAVQMLREVPLSFWFCFCPYHHYYHH